MCVWRLSVPEVKQVALETDRHLLACTSSVQRLSKVGRPLDFVPDCSRATAANSTAARFVADPPWWVMPLFQETVATTAAAIPC